MSIVEKLHCDHCGRDETLTLNHVWTLLVGPKRLEVLRGFERPTGVEHFHLCSADCLSKAVARWAAELPISSSSHQSTPEKTP